MYVENLPFVTRSYSDQPLQMALCWQHSCWNSLTPLTFIMFNLQLCIILQWKPSSDSISNLIRLYNVSLLDDLFQNYSFHKEMDWSKYLDGSVYYENSAGVCYILQLAIAVITIHLYPHCCMNKGRVSHEMTCNPDKKLCLRSINHGTNLKVNPNWYTYRFPII